MKVNLGRGDGHWCGTFDAMASPCELLLEVTERSSAREITEAVAREARRIERGFSRYRDDNIIHRINTAGGARVEVDEETAHLLDFAAHCYALSGGVFDVTSGVLRRAWRFDGSDNTPEHDQVEGLLALVGWQRVAWERPYIALPAGMEIDLGGIGKEYAVDRAAAIVRAATSAGAVVNFGGDLCVTGPRSSGAGWQVGVEAPDVAGRAERHIDIRHGALATSGDARRYLLKDGVRYSHVLDPRTGWPVPNAPRSVTVLTGTCVEAGMLATMAMLRGEDAEAFLSAQSVRYWCRR